MKKLIILIAFLAVGCTDLVNNAIDNLENTQFDNTQEILVAKRALNVAEKGLVDSLKLMFSKDVLLKTKDDVWRKVVKDVQQVVAQGTMPPDSLLQVSNTVNVKIGKKQSFSKISFPYARKMGDKDSLMYINIVVSENKLYGLTVAKYPFGLHILR